MKVSLAHAHATLEVPRGASIDVVKSAYKRLAMLHHPNGNSPESNHRFQDISASYERIVTDLERAAAAAAPSPSPRLGEGMPFVFSFRPPRDTRSRFDRDDRDRSNESDGDGDDEWDSDDDQDQARAAQEYFFWLFEEIMNGGRQQHGSHGNAGSDDDERETATEIDSVEDESVRIERVRFEEQRKAAEDAEKELARLAQKQLETEQAAARRQAKKIAAATARSAAQLEAASRAQARLAAAQIKRSEAFAAARVGDVERVRQSVWEFDVDPTGGKFLPGGKEAVESIGMSRRDNELKSEESSSPAMGVRPELPPTPPASNASGSPVIAQSEGGFDRSIGKKRGKVLNELQREHERECEGASDRVSVVRAQGPAPSSETPGQVETSSPPSPRGRRRGNTSRNKVPPFDPQETLLHIVAEQGQKELYEWLVDHGAVPEERNSSGFTAFHVALLKHHVHLVSSILASNPPDFPPPPFASSRLDPTPHYPVPNRHDSLLAVALLGTARDPTDANVVETIRLVLPFSTGRDVATAWRKVESEQSKRGCRKWKRDAWEEIKWIFVERIKALDFEDFVPPEEYQGRRPRIYPPGQ